MIWGVKLAEDKALQQLVIDGLASENLTNPPQLFDDLVWIYEAYCQLATDRPAGLAAAAIPWSSLDRFAARAGIEGEAFDDFCFLVRVLDDEWTAVQADRSKKDPPS